MDIEKWILKEHKHYGKQKKTRIIAAGYYDKRWKSKNDETHFIVASSCMNIRINVSILEGGSV